MTRVAVIIPAAGQSTRFGGEEKKTVTNLDGRPVWQRTAELFWSREDVEQVLIVVAPEDREQFISRYGHILAFVNAHLVDGGAERFESVANALAKVPSSVDLIAVHDAVRPLTPPHLIDEVFAVAARTGAAMLAVPVADTLKRATADGVVLDTVPRSGLWSAQTPQVFRREWLVLAYARRHEVTSPITDDAQLIEFSGHPVTLVPSTSQNFKITTRDDLELADAILKARSSRPAAKPLHPFDDASW
jgi:2-C-methyl-D-erythritol 4-phosphate cytidylyltransferase